MTTRMQKGIFVGMICVAFFGGMKLLKAVPDSDKAIVRDKACNLRTDLRKLWEDHIVWTRNYIISELADLPDLKDVTNRLLQNQVDIGNAIRKYYGNEAGDKLTKLLKDHILIASAVVKAAKVDDKTKLDLEMTRWKQNAEEIAKFLASANPYWPVNVLQDMLNKHLELTTGEVTSRLKRKWNDDIRSYDQNHDHMLKLSDALADGIQKQFPDKF